VAAPATSTESAAPILRLRGVGRRFGGVHAVRDVDLEVRPGERRAILGPNGAGKTTLFNLIAGDFPPSAGTVELFGSDVTRQPPHRRISYGLTRTYQRTNLFAGLTVRDTLYLALMGPERGHFAVRRRRDDEERRRAEAVALIARVGLEGRDDTLVGELSHGEQRQLELAVALAGQPRVVMLDEPAAGLSPGERQLVTDLLLALERDITLVLIEHDMDVALRVAGRVTIMHDGAVVMEGAPDEIRASERVQALYLGSARG
jgi:branched-chain amino acid transport system ATP-binding protein